MREQPGQTPPERCHPCPVPARSPWLPRRPCPPLPAPGPKYPGRCGRCPLPFSGQNQTHVDVRPRGSLGNGLAWCFPNRVPWNLSIPCGHPWRPGVAAAGPSAGQAPPDTASRSPLSSRFSFVAALAPPSRFLFGPLPTTPLRLLPVLWSPPPPPRLLLACPGLLLAGGGSGCPSGRSRVPAARGTAEPRHAGRPRQVSVGAQPRQARWVACPSPAGGGGARMSRWHGWARWGLGDWRAGCGPPSTLPSGHPIEHDPPGLGCGCGPLSWGRWEPVWVPRPRPRWVSVQPALP